MDSLANELFNEWAIVDVMGHQRFIGLVSEQVIAGQGFIRVDIPENEDVKAWTKLIGPSSIYAITPISESIARAMSARSAAVPVQSWDLPHQLSHVPSISGIDEDTDYDIDNADDECPI